MAKPDLIAKYNVPGPRYTSYPTVPYWNITQWETAKWCELINTSQQNDPSKHLAIYIHLPYCDSLCTFCGCHKHITTNHDVESRYIDAVLKEWQMLASSLDKDSQIHELHLGGGTPTFFDPKELKRLIEGIKLIFPFTTNAELSFEAHPNSTSREHLQVLYEQGFRRVSFGIQDYDPLVQQAIHRIQTYEQVKTCHESAKNHGFNEISHDLVYGLPKQTISGFNETILKTLELKPQRISLYSYAHVPWIKGTGQRGYNEQDLPDANLKRMLYEMAKQTFLADGYVEIGMDHFALPNDSLALAAKQKRLHRNFMGYTTNASSLLIGLGMSAISECTFGFAQNEKTVARYLELVENGQLPLTRGHHMNQSDQEIRKHILNLMCRFETELPEKTVLNRLELELQLHELISDGLVEWVENTIRILPQGIPFVRNCCMAFDAYLKDQIPVKQFSMTI
ncbi:MAG: oxygen-independent coproporphyrinogen oxidase [Fluviicola sp.]|jgi:oxygen-independent coproporphyrinogen-3 oxidase|uniref:oxygen-independent coproporphyrinogen III oxidase n=1 Tax=Fluviicola sp. TaxID=1917219 RepID=UPI0026071920|nr:oxygen-independent coproporphyrinogen III oxidase [Fluviicola sp.]MDF3026690.1 oxygen-independent coproporphyrinogen oxidase [Fluviicola sp.]